MNIADRAHHRPSTHVTSLKRFSLRYLLLEVTLFAIALAGVWSPLLNPPGFPQAWLLVAFWFGVWGAALGGLFGHRAMFWGALVGLLLGPCALYVWFEYFFELRFDKLHFVDAPAK